MENASKALIIAGSVLIAILLISLGLFIFKTTSGVTNQTQDLGKTLEVQQFNSQFLKYIGTSVKGNEVITLCDIVIANNGSGEKEVSLIMNGNFVNEYKKPSAITSSVRNKIKTNKTYKVEIPDKEGYNNLGYISKINITEI